MSRPAIGIHVRLLLVSMFLVASAAAPVHAQEPVHYWSKGLGGGGIDLGTAVATDPAGNVLMAGYFNGTIDLGGGNLASAGASDIFLVKYTAGGAHVWSQRLGSTAADIPVSIATDHAGNIFVTGFFTGTVDFGGGGLASAGDRDIFLAKFDGNGAHLWSQRFGDTSLDGGYSVAVDTAGSVFVTGYYNGTVDFGVGNTTSVGNFDIFIAKYNAAGDCKWSHGYGSTDYDTGRAVACDGAGNVFVTGNFRDTVDFGGGVLQSAGLSDVFLLKLDGNGAHEWKQRFGGIDDDSGTSMATDAQGSVVVGGYFADLVDFGGGTLASYGLWDAFIARYGADGTHEWSRSFGDVQQDYVYAVTIDDWGRVYTTGAFNGSVNLGAGFLPVAGALDIFVASYEADGTYRWGQSFGAPSNDVGYSLATGPPGYLLLAGYIQDAVDFGGGPVFGGGSNDICLVKLSTHSAAPVISAITDVPNDQGRQARIRFLRSAWDNPLAATATQRYEAYRRVDSGPAALTGNVAPSERELRAAGWEQVGTVAAHGEDEYTMVVPTVGDSTIAMGQYYSAFYVRAATADPFTFRDSPADSGWSLDNLAPGMPANFAYDAGGLSWDESSAADFDYFTVYGSNADAFASATVVDYSVAAAMDVTTSPYVFYFVTATDFSGNEGRPARVNTLSSVGGTPSSYVLSLSNYPNPFNPRTTVRYTVPNRGRVTVSIHDARGALVATLFDGERSAGAYSVDWDGRTDGAAGAASGVYFARIEHASGLRSRKMLLLK